MMGFYGRKLVHRVREELKIDLPTDVRIRPCRPGWATRSAGGFSWIFESDVTWLGSLGSQYTVRECAMSPKLTVGSDGHDAFIVPNDSEYCP